MSTAQLAEVQGVTQGLASSFELLEAPSAWIIVLVILPLVALIVWASYGRRMAESRGFLALGILRGLAILSVLLLLARPALVEERQEIRPAEVIVLFDDSASMATADAWLGDDETTAAVSRLTGLDPASSSRGELAKEAMQRHLLPVLEERGYSTHLYSFADGWTQRDAATFEAASSGSATHLGDAIAGSLGANAARHLTDLVVIGDGRTTGGMPMIDAARRATTAGVPVHTILVGDPRPEAGAVLELIDAPSTAMDDDEIAIHLRLSGHADNGPEVDVRLEELENPSDSRGRVLDDETLELKKEGERLTLVAPRSEGLNLGPGESKTRHFLVSTPPLEGESRTEDNRVRLSVVVTNQTIRVLFVDGYPRWEYRFLKEFLKRSDENISVRCYLNSATVDFPQEASAGLDPLTALPTTREELLDNYDVVILGDVNPYSLGGSSTESQAFIAALKDFVLAGGGVLFQAGEFDNPRSFSGTPLEAMLPVKLDPAGRAGFAAAETAFHPQLVKPSAPHEITRLTPNIEDNRRLWEDEDGLAGFYWFFPVERAKAGTTVLLTHPFEENRHGKLPLLVTGYYPSGRTMFLAVDSTWRWNWRFGPTWRTQFWKGAIRWLSLGRLKSGDRRFRIESGRASFGLDERVAIEARVLNEDWQASEEASLDVRWSGPDGDIQKSNLEAVPGRPGTFRGALDVQRPGHHRVWIEEDGAERSSAGFEITLPSKENAEVTPDPAALTELAVATSGTHITLAEIEALLAEFPGDEQRKEAISATIDDAWDRWETLMAILLLLSAEWLLRKRMDLP